MSWFKKLSQSNDVSPNKMLIKQRKRASNESLQKISNETATTSTSATTTTSSASDRLEEKEREEFENSCSTTTTSSTPTNSTTSSTTTSTSEEPACKKRLGELNDEAIEIIDPEEFFQDPEHVSNYKEEAKFLKLMSEWEIIENPATSFANFFSADFEEEFLQMRSQNEAIENALMCRSMTNNNENEIQQTEAEMEKENEKENKTENYTNLKTKKEKEQDPKKEERRKFFKCKIYEIFFTDQIEMGIAWTPKSMDVVDGVKSAGNGGGNGRGNADDTNKRRNKKRKLKNQSEKCLNSSVLDTDIDADNTDQQQSHISFDPTSINLQTCPNDIIKDCGINRAQLKTEALACSIMGAIGKCPAKDSSNTTLCSSENDLLQNIFDIDTCHPPRFNPRCDHYDIKRFFRLDDYGNILLNINHIDEVKGHGFVAQSKRIYRKYRKECECIDEHTFVGDSSSCRGCCFVIRRILFIFWHIMIGHPRNKISPYSSNGAGSGETVRAYTLQLAQDQCSTFARNIENFISCTKESREAAPQVVMRNMRQFMNGMKNYLVKHGEGKFQQEVELARARLKSDEFLNLDAILETVMHQLVVLPLREHLYGMFVDYYTRSEDIQLLAQNVKYACGRCASDFGIRATVTPPSTTSLTVISNLLLRLQEAELPLDKLELFLCVISTIFDATGCPRGQQLGADDFLPILVYVVAKCGFVGAEIEAEFMWGLLQPTLLNGEPGYYLTALCSAVHVLKSFMASENENGSASLDWRSSSLPACSSVLRVIIPDECNGSLQTRTLPVRPHTTTREVCRIIAHKARITNPQDYALFKLIDGEETLLSDIECPQDIRLAAKGKHCMLAYKRIDAKIAWPTATQPVHVHNNIGN